jgi:hypothetical protein
VYLSRYADIQKETRWDQCLGTCKKSLQKLVQDFGEASPYFAILVADGDKMGNAIAFIDSSKKHREFSQALADFAREARSIVQQNSGVLVYAGGDDVLAFVPLDKSVACSRSLYDEFAKNAPWSRDGTTFLCRSVCHGSFYGTIGRYSYLWANRRETCKNHILVRASKKTRWFRHPFDQTRQQSNCGKIQLVGMPGSVSES